MQGKLVPQDPNDEPASELVRKIQTESDRLIAENKTKRGKPLVELADEEKPFVVSVAWCSARLGEVTNYGSQAKAGTLLPDTWVLDMEDIEKSPGRLIPRQRQRFAERPAVSVVGDNYLDRRVASRRSVTRCLVVVLLPFLLFLWGQRSNGACR